MVKAFKKFLLPGIIVIALIIAVVLGVILFFQLRGKCDSLTPLALEKFKIAGGTQPVFGEKCQISKKSYLLIISYDDSEEAEDAKTALEIATPGEKDEIKDLDWITQKDSSAVFWTSGKELAILVVPEEDSEKAVKKELDKALEILK